MTVPSLTGRRVVLRPLDTRDYPYALQLQSDLELDGFWRTGGRTVSPEESVGLLWNDVLCQFTVVSKSTGVPCGIVKLYGANFVYGFAYIQVMGPRNAGMPSPLIDAAVLLIDYAFNTWEFRKLYGESAGSNASQFVSALGSHLACEEGRLRGHIRHGGQLQDYITVAIYREQWNLGSAGVVRFARGSAALADRPAVTAPADVHAFMDWLAHRCGFRLSEVDPALAMEHLPAETLPLVTVLAALRDDFGVELPDDLVEELGSLADLYYYYHRLSSATRLP